AFAQSVAQRYSDRRHGIGRRAPCGDTETGLEGEHARGDRLRLVDPPELSERRRQEHVGNAEAGIMLDRLTGRVRRLLEAPGLEMSEEHSVAGHKAPGVQRAQTQPSLPPFDRALHVASKAELDAAE